MLAEQYYGGSVDAGVITHDYIIGPKSLVVVQPASAGPSVILPDPNKRYLARGAYYHIVNSSPTYSLPVKDYTSTYTLFIIPPMSGVFAVWGGGVAIHGWVITIRNPGGTIIGSALAANAESMLIELKSTQSHFMVRNAAIAKGWDTTTPLAITLLIEASAVIYSYNTSVASIRSGDWWPVGSSLSIICRGQVYGKGGNAGRGGIASTASPGGYPGSNGGPAIDTLLDTIVIVSGEIKGGGGGGGGGDGGATPSLNHGGGGGGGCPGGLGGAATPSAHVGGNSPLFTSSGRIPSVAINTTVAGAGGANAAGAQNNGRGGTGGLPGVAGSPGRTTINTASSTGTGGSPGPWIRHPSSVSLVYSLQGLGAVAGGIEVY